MSTRSLLAYKTQTGFEGCYCHWDGYPTNRGKQIWEIIMQQFILNKGKIGVVNDGSTALQSFVDIYIKGHRGGWSAFPTECYCHSAEFVMRDGVHDNWETNKDTDPLFIEWVYVIAIENKKLIIYTGGRARGEHKEENIKGEKYTSPNYKHYIVCELDINPDEKEPDWESIERKGSDISNEMYLKFKDKEDLSGKTS